MLRDLKFSIRTLFAQPAFAAVAIVALALGIGANTAIFSILNAVLLQRLPYPEPDRLYMLRSMAANGTPTGLMAPKWVEPLMGGNESVETATFGWGLAGSIIAADGTPYPFLLYRVTPRFFDVFANSMLLGSGFKPDEPGNSLILSYSVWQNYFASDPNIVGKVVRADNSPRTVVGVTRRGAEFPAGAQSWQPLYTGGTINDIVNFEAYLRLKPGVTPERFKSELAAVSNRLGPNRETGKPVEYVLRPLHEEVIGDMGSTLVLLSVATGILLLIASINVANLLFARANARSHEIGLREAIGASRLRIIRQLVTESLLLSAIGGILGVALAYTAVRVLLSIGPANLPRIGGVTVDGAVLLFSAATILVTTLLVGLAPAIRLGRTQVRTLIAKGGRGGSAGRADNRVFGALVIAQVGLAAMLVIGAGLLVRSYANLATIDAGFDSSRILTLRLNASHLPADVTYNRRPDGTIEWSGSGYERIINFHRELIDRIRSLNGVVDAAGAQELPMYLNPTKASPEPFTIAGRPAQDLKVRIRPVSANFFSTVGGRILAGRGIEQTDRRGAPGIAVINEAFARQYFPNENPIGRHLGLPSHDFEPTGRGYGFGERLVDDVEIVGVVSDVRFEKLTQPPPPYLFMNNEQFPTRLRVLAVKTHLDDPSSLIPAIRQEVAKMAPTVPIEFGIYSQSVGASIARERLGAALLAVFAAIALVLAAVGVYGVMMYSVTQRASEMAVRSALGATAQQLIGHVLRRGATLGGVGVLFGLAGAMALQQVVASQLYGVSPSDPLVLVLVPLVLLAVALMASLAPALRASRVDPMAALRNE